MKKRILEKSTKWVFSILLPLAAIIIGMNLQRAIIGESWLAIGIAIASGLLIIAATFLNSRTNFVLGQIKAGEELLETLKRLRK